MKLFQVKRDSGNVTIVDLEKVQYIYENPGNLSNCTDVTFAFPNNSYVTINNMKRSELEQYHKNIQAKLA